MNVKLIIIGVSLWFIGCQGDRNLRSPENGQKNRSLTRNDVSINYKQCGDGEVSLVFVHGWCINQSYWSQQFNELCQDFRLVSLDLPGFGNSGRNRADWSIEEYGKDVDFLIKQLNLKNVILVGHSLGGDVILETALQNQNVIALIGIDNFKDVGAEFNDEVRSAYYEFVDMINQNFSVMAPAYAEGNLFHKSTDSSVRNRVMKDFGSADSLSAIPSIISLIDYIPKEPVQLSKLEQKLYLINSNATPTDTTRLNDTGVQYELVDIDSTGHYPMIEKPLIFNRLLRDVIKRIEKTKLQLFY